MKIKILILLFFTLLFIACEKDEIPNPTNNWNTLISYEHLSTVTAHSINLAIQAAGYEATVFPIDYSISVYKIAYKTTYKGEEIQVSGIISIPINKKGELDVVVMGGAGLYFSDENFPSAFSFPTHSTGFEFVACTGLVTLLPDMIGAGDSKDITFPIHNYHYSAQTIVDLIRAGEEFMQHRELDYSDDYLLAGYSQGGYIALSTLKMIQEQNLDIKIKKAGIGAGGYNLSQVVDLHLQEGIYPSPSHFSLLMSSYNEIYEWDKPPSYFFKSPYHTQIPELLGGSYTREEIDLMLPHTFDSLLTQDFITYMKSEPDNYIWKALKENNVDDWAPDFDCKFYHGRNDEKIPFSDTQQTVDKMIKNGAQKVELVELRDNIHYYSGVDFVEFCINWFLENDDKN